MSSGLWPEEVNMQSRRKMTVNMSQWLSLYRLNVPYLDGSIVSSSDDNVVVDPSAVVDAHAVLALQ